MWFSELTTFLNLNNLNLLVLITEMDCVLCVSYKLKFYAKFR